MQEKKVKTCKETKAIEKEITDIINKLQRQVRMK